MPTKTKDVYSRGDVTDTSACLAACDIKKWPADPIIPKIIAKIKLNLSGIMKLWGKKIIEVNNNEIDPLEKTSPDIEDFLKNPQDVAGKYDDDKTKLNWSNKLAFTGGLA